MVLLVYRTTPLPWCAQSPAELLMGRRLRANIPVQTSQLIPDFRRKNASFKERQKRDFDSHHAVRNRPSITSDTPVWITSGDDPVPGRVVSPANTPRSYVVDTPSGLVRRNRQHLNETQPPQKVTDAEANPARSPIQTRLRSGATLHPPDRL